VRRQTLYREFPEQLSRQAEHADPAAAARRLPDAAAKAEIARLRAERDDLLQHVEIYEDHIRTLALTHARLLAKLERTEGVAPLRSRRPSTRP
jgi:hypothetical protein